MKMAKVSSVYEGKLRKRGIEGEDQEEEELGRSRKARKDAKDRRHNSRMKCRAPPLPSNGSSTIVASLSSTFSTSSLSVEKENEKEKGKQKENQDMQNAEEFENEKQTQDENKIEEKETTEVINIDDDEQVIIQEVINIEEEKEQMIETEMAAVMAALPAEPARVAMGENGWFVGLKDWPMIWTYEEEWMWWGMAPLGLRSNPYWEYISGVGWVQK